MTTDFNETWGPTWEVQKSIPHARACVIENTGRTFKTGRAVVDAVFFDGNRREICRRTGMRLTSKKGNDYVVCRREPERGCTGATHAADSSPATAVGELFDDL